LAPLLGADHMTDHVDTGFDAVLAGEVWTPPEEPQPTITISEAPPQEPHTCANAHGGTTCDVCFGPVTATVTPGLTPAGVQAAKALVQLPPLSPPDLAKLAREMAMDIKERSAILTEFKLSETQYDFLEANNEFYKAALHAACIEWHAPLSTQERIKVEAAAILEDSLPGLGARMQNKGEGLPGVIEAAKLFAKVAGVGEREVGPGNSGERFVINIDLGGDQKITVETAPAPTAAVQSDHVRALPKDGGTS
jgi:hypothetical protein